MAKSVPRRTPKELLFVLERLGCTHFLLVEGYADRAFYRWLLDWRRESPLSVHAIDEVEIPAAWLTPEADFSNNRTLVALAAPRIAQEREGVSVLGVIDADCGVPAEWAADPSIAVTDFPSIESYCFTPETLQKFVVLTLDLGEQIDGESLRDELAPVLAGLFEVRSQTGGLGATVEHVLTFDNAAWIAHFRSEPARAAERVRMYGEAVVPPDPRDACYGHDLAAVLMVRFVARIKNRAGLRSVEDLERSLLAHLERSEILQHPLADRLLRWISEAAA